MTFRALLARIYDEGVRVWSPVLGKIRYRSPVPLAPEVREALKEHKDDLLYICNGGTVLYERDQQPAEWRSA